MILKLLLGGQNPTQQCSLGGRTTNLYFDEMLIDNVNICLKLEYIFEIFSQTF